MTELEGVVGLVLAAVLLAAAARRVGVPYPVFLAVAGVLLAFLPGAPSFTVPPELALALFVAPVLLDAAYDTSPRDLRDNWVPVTGLAVIAVGLTTVAVAVVARALIPAIPWAPAVALGAIVAPLDAAAATAVLRAAAATAPHPHDRRRRKPVGRRQCAPALPLGGWRRRCRRLFVAPVAPTFLIAVAGSLIV